jgi:putative two-component system response regulator
VFQIVDIHDALTFERPYKPALGEAQARAILEEETARGWRDPALIRAFFDWVGRNPAWAEPPALPMDDLGIQLYASLSSAG